MPDVTLNCWRCGHALTGLSLPLSRMDECSACAMSLHVCRMCKHYDRHAIDQCRLEEAPYVKEKERPNFCDYFTPNPDAWQPDNAGAQAQDALDALFGGPDPGAEQSASDALNDLFKSDPK